MKRKTNDEKILRMLKEGHTQRQIAKHFGVSEPAISKRVKRLLPLPESFKNLTDKEKKFVLAIANGKTQTQAALHSFDVGSFENAKSMGSHLMDKADIKLAVSEIMEQEGLTKRHRVRKLKQHVEAKDPGISLKALDQSWKLDGAYTETHVHHIESYGDICKNLEEIRKEKIQLLRQMGRDKEADAAELILKESQKEKIPEMIDVTPTK